MQTMLAAATLLLSTPALAGQAGPLDSPSSTRAPAAAPSASASNPCACAGGAQTLYAISSSALYRIDDYDSAPVAVLVGNLNLPPTGYLTDIAYVEGSATLYALMSDGRSLVLDTSNGAVTVGVKFPAAALMYSLDSDGSGILYGHQVGAGAIRTIDMSVPSSTLVGSTSDKPGGDCAFDVDGTLYGVSSANVLQIIDLPNIFLGIPLIDIGTLGTNALASGLEIDCDGTMYAGDEAGGFYRVDKQTGTTTQLAWFAAMGNIRGLAFVRHAAPTIATYCVSGPNSTGLPASMSWSGGASVSAATLQLRASGLPGGLGVFACSATTAHASFGNGAICLGGSPTLLVPATFPSGGLLTYDLDFANLPGAGPVQAGDTWYFQAWFRDVAAGGSKFDSSNGMRVTFCP